MFDNPNPEFPGWNDYDRYSDLPDGVPCNHPGCLAHITHPCEGCGRVGGVRAAKPIEKRRLAIHGRSLAFKPRLHIQIFRTYNGTWITGCGSKSSDLREVQISNLNKWRMCSKCGDLERFQQLVTKLQKD